jgi:hypothetical protein
MSQQIVAWAQAKMGQKVGAGECWDLADQALRASGAASSTTTGVQRTTIAITPGTTTNTVPKTVKADDGKMKAAKIVTTVTVTISGKIWVYRPKPK